MRIALISPPFIAIPPQKYGGTELFISHLASGLKKRGVEVVLYTNGESTSQVEKRWLYQKGEWPIKGEVLDSLKDINHTSWAMADAAGQCDLIHLNNAPGIANSRFIPNPLVYTIHHVHQDSLTSFYQYFPDTYFVTISRFQQQREKMPRLRTIHHGIDLSLYRLTRKKQPYLSFVGRIAPMKGTHLAIEVAQKAGIPLKIAGEVQPMYRDYFERQVKPLVDGKFIEFLGPADLEAKNQLLGESMAMLFPIQWDEPFGLVMAESMACGTPVIALPGGSVAELVRDGLSGVVCQSVDEMAQRAQRADQFDPAAIRSYAEKNLSVERMVRDYEALYSEILGLAAPVAADGFEGEPAVA